VPPDALAQLRHDLRTPASHILGYAEMLEEEAGDRHWTSFVTDLRRIQDAGRTLADRIRNELAPEKVAAGGVDLRLLHADLRTPLNHALGYSEILLEQAESDGHPDLIPDLQRIHQAARDFLRLMEERLVPEMMAPSTSPKDAVASLAEPTALVLSREGPSVRPSSEPDLGGVLLVVDDDPGNRDLLTRRLSRQGFEVHSASSGPEALDRLHSETFDLILLDLLMPGMDGHEVLRRLKADPRLREIPVIVLSAMDDTEGVVRCILAGAEDYLAKPFNVVLLRARLSTSLEKARLRRREREHLTAIESERRKSDTLLLNILPQAIAKRLKDGETTIVDSLPQVTVLFADLVGFTQLAGRLKSTDLVRLLDEVFSGFDSLAEVEGLEKIKTIGDAYMVVGGLPTPRRDHARAVADLALAMLDQARLLSRDHGFPIQLRIGIHTGPVIAGIIGRRKFSYDLWGDTVNIASRMESHGLPGHIQISRATRLRLRTHYQCESRGAIDIKGIGLLPTWWLLGRNPLMPKPKPV
jgi:class 3 adenylate cyclase